MPARIYLMKFSVKFSIFAFNKISAQAEPSTKSFASAYVAATAAASVAIFVCQFL